MGGAEFSSNSRVRVSRNSRSQINRMIQPRRPSTCIDEVTVWLKHSVYMTSAMPIAHNPPTPPTPPTFSSAMGSIGPLPF